MTLKGSHFKVEIRHTCKTCGKPITEKKFRTYCSKPCRTKAINNKHRASQSEWQRKRQDAKASKPSPNKIKCLICGRYYVQVCTHIFLRHHLTAREYKTEFGLDVKRGKLPDWYRKVKGDQALENGTVINLEKGKKYWFKKGDPKAGKYTRSEETMARLKHLHSFNKK